MTACGQRVRECHVADAAVGAGRLQICSDASEPSGRLVTGPARRETHESTRGDFHHAREEAPMAEKALWNSGDSMCDVRWSSSVEGRHRLHRTCG